MERQVTVHLQRGQTVGHGPVREGAARLRGHEGGGPQAVTAEVLGAAVEEVEAEAGVVVRVEVMAAHEVRRVGAVVHDRVDVVRVVAHVDLDQKPLGIEGHDRLLVAREAHVEADPVGADLLEERQVLVRDAELVEHARVAVEHDLEPQLVGTGVHLRVVAADVVAAVGHGQQAGEDTREPRVGGLLHVVEDGLARGLLGVDRDAKSFHAPSLCMS